MNPWLENTLARTPLSDWLAPQREASLALLRSARWPNRKVEAWKYTPVRVLEQSQFDTTERAAVHPVSAIEGLVSIDIAIVNGRPVLPSDLPDGLRVQSLSVQSELAASLFGQVKPTRHVFGLVNDVLAQNGVVIDVADGVKLDRPVRIIYSIAEGVEAHARVLVRIGEGASATVIEQGESKVASFATHVAEYQIGIDAVLEHYRLALYTDKALNLGGCHFALSDRASLISTVIGFGSELSRLDIDVIHKGSFTHAKLNAIYLLNGTELFDLHTTIEHTKANGTTEENVRGIVADRAKAVFNGRIHIHRDAQKTLAALNNRNLLLSEHAEINTKPELEIYADDVRCAHGATVAEIDKGALYYLQSRGIDRTQAQIMLNFGFINELVDDMKNSALAEWLRPKLRERFAKMDVK